MNKIMVNSTTLVSIAYDEISEILQLQFCSGSIYQYFGVPTAVQEALLNAASKGSYFNKAIRGRFLFALAASAEARRAEGV